MPAYRSTFPIESDSFNAPKDPENALMALIQYAVRYQHTDAEDFEILPYTELAGYVPVLDDGERRRNYYFKIDALVRRKSDNKIWVMEHKTGSRITAAWTASWLLSMQVLGYVYAAKCLFPAEEIGGAYVDGLIFQKKQNQFERVQVPLVNSHIYSWVLQTNYWMDLLDWNLKTLREELESPGPVMQSFPCHPDNCTMYNSVCPFHTLCMIWNNPLTNMHRKPPEFEVEFWDPMKVPHSYEAMEGGIHDCSVRLKRIEDSLRKVTSSESGSAGSSDETPDGTG